MELRCCCCDPCALIYRNVDDFMASNEKGRKANFESAIIKFSVLCVYMLLTQLPVRNLVNLGRAARAFAINYQPK